MLNQIPIVLLRLLLISIAYVAVFFKFQRMLAFPFKFATKQAKHIYSLFFSIPKRFVRAICNSICFVGDTLVILTKKVVSHSKKMALKLYKLPVRHEKVTKLVEIINRDINNHPFVTILMLPIVPFLIFPIIVFAINVGVQMLFAYMLFGNGVLDSVSLILSALSRFTSATHASTEKVDETINPAQTTPESATAIKSKVGSKVSSQSEYLRQRAIFLSNKHRFHPKGERHVRFNIVKSSAVQ